MYLIVDGVVPREGMLLLGRCWSPLLPCLKTALSASDRSVHRGAKSGLLTIAVRFPPAQTWYSGV